MGARAVKVMAAGVVDGRGRRYGRARFRRPASPADRHEGHLAASNSLLDLEEAIMLRSGDALALEDGRLVEVLSARSRFAEIRAKDAKHLVRVAWHLGNRHLPTQILGQKLRIRRAITSSGHGTRPRRRGGGDRGRRSIRKAAYAQHVMTHGHDHGHGHHHDHDHDRWPSRPPPSRP